MKKVTVVVLVTVFLGMAVSAHAEDRFSFGFGGRFYPYFVDYNAMFSQYPGYDYSEYSTKYKDWGVFAYFDFVYVLLEAGYSQNISEHTKQTLKNTTTNAATSVEGGWYSFLNYVDLGLYIKYPIHAGSALVLSPVFGAQVRINITAEDTNGNDVKAYLSDEEKTDFTQVWLKAGIFMDMNLSRSLYIRPQAMIGYKLISKYMDGYADELKLYNQDVKYLALSADLGVSVGYRF